MLKLRPLCAMLTLVLASAWSALPAFAQTPAAQGPSLVCAGLGGDGLSLVEWSASEIADYTARTGNAPLRPHPHTGECRDPAGLPVGAGWTPDWFWLCSQSADGRWVGPHWVVSIYRQGNEAPPSPVTGGCPQPQDGNPAGLTEIGRAAATAVHLTELEVAADYDRLYAWMHPDAQSLIAPEVITGWYRDVFAPRPPVSVSVESARLAGWTWGVTGVTYPTAAEIELAVRYGDGTEAPETVRLVRDNGVWRWFFGRDRAFVDEQIARYG